MLARALGVAESKFITEEAIVDGGVFESLLCGGFKRDDAIVELRNEDVAIGVFHAGQKLDELKRVIDELNLHRR